MLLTPHMVVGGIIGDLIQNIPAALILGIISHFIFDGLPHVETSTFKKYFGRKKGEKLTFLEMVFEVFEIAVGLTIMFYFWKFHNYQMPIFWGAFGAALPDLIDNVPFWSWNLRKYPVFKQVHWLHNKIHFDLNEKNWYLGLPIYVGIAIAVIFLWR